MRTMIRLAAVVIMIGLVISGAAYAASAPAASSAVEKKAAVVNVGNKICPVMGGKVSGKDFYEYKGKRYGLCCPMCPATFAGDPEKYAAIAEKEVAGKK